MTSKQRAVLSMRCQAVRVHRPQAVRVSWVRRLWRATWEIDAISCAWAGVVIVCVGLLAGWV